MNDELLSDLKKAINELKKEIIDKQKILDSLITQYQELSGVELLEDSNPND